MDAMSDLVQSMKKTNWHTVAVLAPGLTFLALAFKMYIDMSTASIESVLSTRMDSIEQSQQSAESRVLLLSEQFMEVTRGLGKNCRSDSSVNSYRATSD